MTLSDKHLADIYASAKAVHRKQVRRVDAIRKLEATGIDADRAGIHLDVVRGLLAGDIYKRRLTPAHTEHYLESISLDQGAGGLRTALDALVAHIEYLKAFHNVADFLEIRDRFVSRLGSSPEIDYPDEVTTDTDGYQEGSVKAILINQYERDPKARKACLDLHGYDCKVCGFNFLETYGERGRDFVHVHHIVPLATIGKSYKVNPAKDLVPVCPNCHAMLHRGGDLIEVEALKNMLHRVFDEETGPVQN